MAELFCSKRVTGDEVDKIFTPGCYGHGSGLFTGGVYGILIVICAYHYNYTLQIDFNATGKIYWRLTTNKEWGVWSEL